MPTPNPPIPCPTFFEYHRFLLLIEATTDKELCFSFYLRADLVAVGNPFTYKFHSSGQVGEGSAR
jgi:hypothetical protein